MIEKCLVLIYHRVLELENDPQLLTVTPDNFERQILWLKENYNIIPLKELIKALTNKKVPNNSIVITFDDGYFDNLYYAKTILEKHKVPATIFVSTGLIGKDREFWWDELERLFLTENILNKRISFYIENKLYEWFIDSKEKSMLTYKEIHPILKYLKNVDREKIIEELFCQLGLDRNQTRKTHRILNEKELKDLSDSDYIEIGAHTVNHCVLSMEDIPTQEMEIMESKIYLENITNKPITSFSYPFGTKQDYNINTIETLKRAGFKYAIANSQGFVTKETDLYEIPRFLVRNWSVDLLSEKLKLIESRDNNKKFIHNKIKKFLSLLKKIFFIKNIVKKIINYLQKYNSNEIKKRFNEINEKLSITYNLVKNDYYNLLLKPKLINTINSEYRKTNEFKNILHINTNDKKGGAARICYTLHKNYLERSLDSNILCYNKTDEEDNIYKISFHHDKFQSFLYDLQENVSYQDFFHLSSFDIKDYYIFKKSDILHLHNLHGNYFSLFALPELTHLKPTVWTLHDMQAITGHCAHSFDCNRWMNNCGNCPNLSIYPSIQKDETAFILKNKKMIYENSKLTIVCPSKWLKNKVEKSILKNHDIRLIYNGIDTNLYNKKDKKLIREKLNLPQHKIILLFSADGGVNNPWKGTKYIFDAYNSFYKLPNLFFVNIGGSKNSKNKKNWLDVPYIKDESLMSDYYAASDLFIYPSLADNCPLVVLEALACGLPVITFETGGIPELVKHLETGYIAKYKELNDFISGIKLFINNIELLNKASILAREHAVNNFDKSKMVDSYLKLYEEILKTNSF